MATNSTAASFPHSSTAPPPNIDRRQDFGVFYWVLTSVSAVIVLSRLYVRRFIRKTMGGDDRTIALAMVVSVANDVFATLGIRSGMLIHIYYLQPADLAKTIQWVKVNMMLCIVTQVLIKISVCISFLRIIEHAKRGITISFYVLMATLILTGIAAFLLEAFQCVPWRKLWIPMLQGYCLNNEVVTWMLVAYGVVCTLTDFICGIVPILILIKLQMDKSTKIALCILLGLVIVPCICSAMRTVQTLALNNKDVTWAISGPATWITLEIHTGLIVACLPMLWAPIVAGSKATSTYISGLCDDYRSWRAWRSGGSRFAQQNDTTNLEMGWVPATSTHRSKVEQDRPVASSSEPRSLEAGIPEDDMWPLTDTASAIIRRTDLAVYLSSRFDVPNDPIHFRRSSSQAAYL